MRILFLLLVITFLSENKTFCQEKKQTVELRFSPGFVNASEKDRLINYYTYSQYRFTFPEITAILKKNKNILIGTVHYHRFKMKPVNMPEEYYEYNYLKNFLAQVHFRFYREIEQKGKIKLYLGIANNSVASVTRQFYKTLLYDFTEGFRKSYDISVLNIHPSLLITGEMGKNNLMLETGYSLIQFGVRPDDNFVKQNMKLYGAKWKMSTYKNYTNFILNLSLHHSLSDVLGIFAGYSFSYYSNKNHMDYQFLSHTYLLGLTISI